MSTEQVRDLILVPEALRSQREQAALAVLRDWAAEWIPSDANWQASLQTVCSTELAIDAGAHEFAQASSAAQARLAAMMIGRERGQALPESDWAWQSAATALDALQARMAALAPGFCAAGSQPDLRKLSGIVVVKELGLGLSWAWSTKEPEPSKPGHVSAVSACLAQQPVSLAVGLGEVEIAVSDLLALQIGDVIRFPSLLKSPVPLSIGTRGDAKLSPLSAKLGEHDGHVAIQLASTR